MSSFPDLKGPNTNNISNFESGSSIDRRFSSKSSSKSRADSVSGRGSSQMHMGGMCRGFRTTLPGEATKGGKRREAQETQRLKDLKDR
ncbi:Aspartate--tRNA ligase, cytoplasmic [Fusarium oxysporum f. sp. albedinis]|nr:Aspartate--tRNA ligase, cytoplasmic [Fusarium oxysporum f. sp. albedinis]